MRSETTDKHRVCVDFQRLICYTEDKKRGESMSKESTKKDIIEAFWTLYQVKDISKISVKELCEIAGYHRTTFYDHFTDVYDVLNQLERSLLPPFESSFEVLSQSIEFSDFTMLLEQFLSLLIQNKEYLSIIIGQRKDPYFQDRIKQMIRPVFLKYFKAQDLPDSYSAYVFEYQISAVFGLVTFWFQNGENLSKEELMKLLDLICNNGVFHLINKR